MVLSFCQRYRRSESLSSWRLFFFHTKSICQDVTYSGATLTHCYRQISVKQAKEYSNIQIVSIDWLLDSLEADARADESNYLLTSSDSLAKGDATAKQDPETGNDNQVEKEASKKTNTGIKRTRNSDLDESISLDPKSQGQPQAKKIRDGQKAKSCSLQVPVDEGCNLTGNLIPIILPLLSLTFRRVVCCLHRQ